MTWVRLGTVRIQTRGKDSARHGGPRSLRRLAQQLLWTRRDGYEVRCTYDTPEIAEHRRLVDEAKQSDDSAWEPTGWSPDDDEEIEW